MKNLLFVTLFSICLFASCSSDRADTKSCSSDEVACGAQSKKQLRHVVMFGFKPELTVEQIKQVEDAFAALPSKIEQVKGYEWGTNCSPEPFSNGLTHCFTLTFNSDADRDAYLIHPAHKEFGTIVDGKLSGITVLDYWVK